MKDNNKIQKYPCYTL